MDLLLERSELPIGSQVLDVGCGLGGTSRYLAKKMGCTVTGITISGQQVKLARNLSAKETGSVEEEVEGSGFTGLGDGRVRFLELDAEKMGDYFTESDTIKSFDCIWISEAMSHLPDKELFFRNASTLLKAGGKLIVADWFKAEELTDAQMEADIRPIEGKFLSQVLLRDKIDKHEDGMLLPGLNTQSEYVNYAKQSGLRVFSEPLDISKQVAKTWYVPAPFSGTSISSHDPSLLTCIGIYHGHWSRSLLFGPLQSLRVEMGWLSSKRFEQ